MRGIAKHYDIALDSTNAKLQQLHQELFITKQARSDRKNITHRIISNKCEKLESENSALGTELEEKIQAELQWDEGIIYLNVTLLY